MGADEVQELLQKLDLKSVKEVGMAKCYIDGSWADCCGVGINSLVVLG